MFKNNNKGFSLVELIVVIAIMAVMIAVLAPALLQYTEKSRAEKDVSAMSEVTNAVQLALSDQDCYDEVVHYNTKDNVSCYIDTRKESDHEKIITKEATSNTQVQYTFGDDSRLLDETPYFAAGKMRGVTITFSPNIVDTNLAYDLASGVVNEFNGETTVLSNLPTLYNRVRQTVGDTIKLDSQTYRNSDYTIFIKIGSAGGNQSSAQDAVQVYGQFSGTNLIADQEIDYSSASVFGDVKNAELWNSDWPSIEYEDGMTWAQWVESEYNTIGAKIYSGNIIIPDKGYLLEFVDYGDEFVKADQLVGVNEHGYEIDWSLDIRD